MTTGREYTKHQRKREQELIARDKAWHAEEIMRAAAEIRVREGVTAMVVDTVVPPTPEWMQQGDTETYIPRQPDGTVAQVKTVRRVRTPITMRLLHRGKIDNEQYQACHWYAECYERAGFHGPIPSVNMGQEVFGGGADRVLFTEAQQQAQRDLRQAKAVIPKHMVRFFEAVVIGNVPVTRASRFIRMKPHNALKQFRIIADKLVEPVKNLGGIA